MRWQPLDRAEVRRAWSWRDDVQQMVLNTDIDGLLTGALLHHLKGWPVVGFYDTETLWLSADVEIPLDLRRTAWVDVDMSWPGALSISQHVITVESRQSDAVLAHRGTVNPNRFVGCHGGSFDIYREKYPFGTFQWVAWIAGAPDAPDPADPLLTGLAWMPDGGFMSVNHPSWRRNCLSWATRILPGSLLEPLAKASTTDAGSVVEAAARRLVGASVLPPTWRNLQYVMSENRHGFRTLVDPASATGLADVQAVLDAVARAYGWRRLQLPLMPRRFKGGWHSGRRPPAGWPASANDGSVVSFAITGNRRYCWTTPSSNSPHPPLSSALA